MKQFIIQAKEWAGSFTIERTVGKKKVPKKINIRVLDNECFLEYTQLVRKLEPLQKRIKEIRKEGSEETLTDSDIAQMSASSIEQIKLLCPEITDEDFKGIDQVNLKGMLQYVTAIAGGAQIDRTEEEKKSPSLSATEPLESSEAESQAS